MTEHDRSHKAVFPETNVMKDYGTGWDSASATWHMTQSIWGAMRVQAISVIAGLGIADLVADEPRTAGDLAATTHTHPETLRRVLRALATLGIFVEDTAGRFANTPLSETLRSDHPASVRPLAMIWGRPLFWRPWGEFRATLVSGEPAFERVFHESFFDRLGHEVEDASVFNAAMASFSDLEMSAVLAAYDFSRFRRLVDIGGGVGALLNGILTATPDLNGVLYDLPVVVANALELRAGAAAKRCEIIAGDFFESVPSGADAYLLKRIIHDWNDRDALRILSNCRRAISDDGTLVLIEWVLKPPNEPDPGKFMDLHMLVILGGMERTASDFRALLKEAGFALTRVIPTGGPHSIIESSPL